ncbi:MAG: DUF4332 domain-containing protein [Anaerolineales bacterium]|nr:DUF4332 domain-containing protein [Anaerolineales bacterium]
MEVLAALVGAGIVAASPFLPVLRPMAKVAVKGGLAVSEAVVGASVVVAQQVSEVTHRDKAKDKVDSVDEGNTPAEVSEVQEMDASQPLEETETTAQATGLSSLAAALRPTAETAIKAGLAFSDKAKVAVAAAGKQWSDLVVEAKESQNGAVAEEVIDMELAVEQETAAEAKVVEVETAVEPQVVKSPDDLTKIKGVGPKTAALLEAAGITTYTQLAAANEAQLRQILDEAGSRYRIIDPTNWPEQASSAANKA